LNYFSIIASAGSNLQCILVVAAGEMTACRQLVPVAAGEPLDIQALF
jgi:hypothetical protein